jgi:hypothetical protein
MPRYAICNETWGDLPWADTCRQVVLKLADGTLHRANFNLSK